jgi:hypothetical protein
MAIAHGGGCSYAIRQTMAEKKKKKRIRLRNEGVPAYDPNGDYKPYNPFQRLDRDDDGEIGLDGLNLRQRLFVQAYIGPAGGAVATAARMAGYGRKNAISSEYNRSGMQLLQLPMVQEAIARELARKKMSEDWTRLTLFELANSNLGNFLDVDESGEFLRFNFKKAQALGAMRQLNSYEAKTGKITVRDRVPALQVLAKFYNLIRENDPQKELALPLEEHPLNGRVEPPAGLE